jgi:glucokinase
MRRGQAESSESDAMRTGRVLAVDVGGTKLAAGVVTSDGEVLAEAKTATGVPGAGGGETLFARLERLCRDALDDATVAVDAIGVGCGGPMRYPDGVVSPLHIPAWREFPLRERFVRAFGHPCVVDNDAKAVALGEWWRGAGRGKRHLLGMVVSTGVGGGLIVDGRLVQGAHGHAGHIGHVNVAREGVRCECGARGCVSAYASGTGLSRRYRDETGAARSAAEIAELARHGDELAMRLYAEAGDALGRGIASVEALCDLEIAIVGGSVALRAWDLLGPPLEASLRASAQFEFTRDIQVVPAQLGERAGLLGAACLALGEHSE